MSIESVDLESPSIIGAGIGAVTTAVGWFARSVFNAQRENKREIEALKLELAGRYVPREEIDEKFRSFQEAVEKRLDRTDEKLDRLLDHLHGVKP